MYMFLLSRWISAYLDDNFCQFHGLFQRFLSNFRENVNKTPKTLVRDKVRQERWMSSGFLDYLLVAFPFTACQEDEVAGVEDGGEDISQHNGQLIDVKRIDQCDHTPPEAEMPKDVRYDQLLSLLGIEPLDYESEAEQQVSCEAENGPQFRLVIEPRHH
jgi:hypothetical protein